MKTLFHHARFFPSTHEKPCDSMLVEHGRIIRMGLQEHLKNKIAPGDREVHLHGHTLIPGLMDAHMHLFASGVNQKGSVSLREAASIAEVVNMLREAVNTGQGKIGEWVFGNGWNQDRFQEKRVPSRHDLDRGVPDHPVKITRMCCHICVVNSKALQMARITRDTPDPPGGKIDRDDRGEPTGILRETAMELVDRVIPPVTDVETIKELILGTCHQLAAMGIVTVHTDDLGSALNRDQILQAYWELDSEEKLPLDVVLQLRVSTPEDIEYHMKKGMHSGRRWNRLAAGAVKIMGDGSLGSRTAALEAPYDDEPEESGFMLLSRDELEGLMVKAVTHSFDLAVHAIGDQTMNAILDVVEKHHALIQEQKVMPAMVHCQIASEEIMERCARLGVSAIIQPIFLYSDWSIAQNRVGQDRLKTSYCWKTWLDRGVHCAGSSDAPVESFNPFHNLHAAVARKDGELQPAGGWIPEEALTLEQAVNLMTAAPARLTREEKTKGRLQEGCEATFAVLSRPIDLMDPDAIRDMTVEAVYQKGIRMEWPPGTDK